MKAGSEIEAKLLAPEPDRLAAIASRSGIGSHRLIARRSAQLRSVYLDTAELSLLRHGVCLRVRNDGGRREATAKWMGRVQGAIHERPELTVPLAAAPRARFRLPDGPLRERLAAIVAGRPLQPILVTEVEREVIDLVPAAAGEAAPAPFAELALDRVRLLSPAKPPRVLSEYAEVEVELRTGTRAALAALSRRLQHEHGLRPERETKFARGVRLLHGGGVLQGGAFTPPAASDDLQTAARKVLGRQLAQIREHDPGVRRGEDPEELHKLRVAVRRARAALRPFAAAMPAELRKQLARELRWLGDRLGRVRDLDVQLALYARAARAAEPQHDGLAELCAQLGAERERRRGELLRALGSRRYFRLLITLEDFAAGRGQPATRARRESLRRAGRVQLEQTLEKVRKRGRKLARGKAPPAAGALHELRIRAKRLRYLLEFLSELTGKAGRRQVKRLVRLQDLLGEHQDAVVAAQFIERHLARARTRLSPASERALRELATEAHARAARASRGFPAAWRELAGGRSQAEFRRLLRRLSPPAASSSKRAVRAGRRA